MTLGDACDQLIASGSTGTLVMSGSEVVGVITENDILAALMDGIDRDIELDLWLRGGKARLPGRAISGVPNGPSSETRAQGKRRHQQA